MKLQITALLFALFFSAGAECLPVNRFSFELPESAGSIRKMQIDLNQIDDHWSVEVRSLSKDGKVLTGHIGCPKISENEFHCFRTDNGGGFDLTTQPTPKLTVKFFTADQEGDEVRTFVVGPKGDSATYPGKKVAITAGNLF